ncbi:MAG: hypothetical protein IPH59_05360 [bacterium]|nr:hypothetical protein [bacterium]
MSSFNKYINGTDPASPVETYGYMRGLVKDPISGQMVPMVNPSTGMTTKFAVSGDPVNQIGWVDAAAADRRLMLSAGPFNMAPGDTQEVVVAVVVAQGSNPINSISALKAASVTAQTTYDLGFDIPSADQIASVYSRGLDSQIELFWSGELVGDVQYSSLLNEEYHFEGFNVYQGQTEVGPWEKIATYDVVNEVALIYADVVDPIAGGTQRIIIQNGTNSGLQFQRLVGYDTFTDQPLVNGHTYHFGVSGYHYDVNHMVEFTDLGGNFLGYLTPVLESPIVKIEEVPIASPGSVTDTAVHISGQSEGRVIIETIDQAAVTGHDYRITFADNGTWDLIDLTTGLTILNNQTNQSGDYNYPVVDGFMPRVFGPEPGISGWSWIGDRWMTGVDASLPQFFGGLGNGIDFFGSNVGRNDYKDVEIRLSLTATQKGIFTARTGQLLLLWLL